MTEHHIFIIPTVNTNSIELLINGETIILSLESDVDFTQFVKSTSLSTLIPEEKHISFNQPASEDPKISLVLKTIKDITDCFNASLTNKTAIEENM